MDRRVLVANFLETKDQSKISRVDGKVISQQQILSKPIQTNKNRFFEDDFLNKLTWNFVKYAGPLFCTAMLSTITYPLAVRVARSKRLFKLRDFYAIHISIAPFLAVIHINFFQLLLSYIRIKQKEKDLWDVKPNLEKEYRDVVECNLRQREITPGCEPYGYYFYQI